MKKSSRRKSWRLIRLVPGRYYMDLVGRVFGPVSKSLNALDTFYADGGCWWSNGMDRGGRASHDLVAQIRVRTCSRRDPRRCHMRKLPPDPSIPF